MAIYMWRELTPNQWPCDSWFHIPTKDEWGSVYTIWTTLWWWNTDGTNFWIALKLPFAWRRNGSTADVSNQGTAGSYWASTSYETIFAYDLGFTSTALNSQDANIRAHGFSVRWFSDYSVTPTLTWTKLYWTSIEAGWIFWNSTLWLISLSSNWTNWITIADKNLWATTVWNSWNTLSEANCGKYYQWGNNYWFPRTWTITNTSTTQVDASTYWPWNYYSSDTFIKKSWSWDSSNNTNLRWWDEV